MDPEPINVIEISVNKEQELKLIGGQFTRVEGNLNRDPKSPVTLWYKRGGDNPVTSIQFSFRNEMTEGLRACKNFTPVEKNINTGTTGDPIQLWYKRGTTEFDFPNMDLRVTSTLEDEPELFSNNWERLGCDLNRNNGGGPVYVWVKRRGKTYICDIEATIGFTEKTESGVFKDVDLFNQGYFRVDEDTNRGVNPAGDAVFIWYRRSTHCPNRTITDIDVSANDGVKGSFTRVDKNLNSGTAGNPVFLWYRSAFNRAVQHLTVLVCNSGNDVWDTYRRNNISVVNVNLNNGIPGSRNLYIAYK